MKNDERDIIEKVLRGETQRYAYFVERYGDALFSLVHQMVGCREDAEEITQDAFLKAFEKLSSFDADSKFSTWLYRIAYNGAISALRKSRHTGIAIAEERLGDIDDNFVDEALNDDSEEMLERLDRAMDLLEPEERSLITLHHIEERSIGETAHITGLSESNVKVKLHRTRKKLYILIKEERI